MLLFRGPHRDTGLSTQELQAAMDKVMGWFEGLNARGKGKAAQPLADRGEFCPAGTGTWWWTVLLRNRKKQWAVFVRPTT